MPDVKSFSAKSECILGSNLKEVTKIAAAATSETLYFVNVISNNSFEEEVY